MFLFLLSQTMRIYHLLSMVLSIFVLASSFASAQLIIDECSDITALADLNTGYVLTQDLDCTAWGNDLTIGSHVSPFGWTFDGNNNSITIAFDTWYSWVYGWLFRYISGWSVSNLTVLGTMDISASEVWGIAGRVYQSSLSNVHFSGSITVGENQLYIWWIAGRLEESSLNGGSAYGTISALLNSSTVGWLVWLLTQNATISYSYAHNDVSGYYNVGWLVGEWYDTVIENSYAAGNVESRAVHGWGIIGYADETSINDSYALGDVYAVDNAWWLAWNVRWLYVNNAYAVGSITTGATNAGWLLWWIESWMSAIPNAITGYFWDVDTTNMAWYFGSSTWDGSTGLITSEMYNIYNYLNAGWDFTGTWDINTAWNNNYPFLQWQSFDTTRGSEVMIYMNNNGPDGANSQSLTIEYVNSYDADLTGVVLTLYGNIYATGYQEASGWNNPTFNGMVDGSYIQWIIPSFPKNASGVLDISIIQPTDGLYVYTATIAAPYNTEYYPGNNSFYVESIVDTLTQAPTLSSPTDGSSHVNTAQMDISFSIPEAALANSLRLYFIPTDLSGGTISLTLADVVPTIQQNVSLYPEDIMTLPWVTSTNGADSIPNGTYTVVLSYQDVFGNPTANATVNDVTIIDAPTPYVLTQVTQVPSTISSNTALYVFSYTGTWLADVVATPCGRSSEIRVSDPGLSTTIQVEISLLEAGKTYSCQIAFRSLGNIYSNRLDIGPFTVRSSGGGGGWSVSWDYCPYGDTSWSYYDGNCWPEKSLVEKIVATLISRWASRSPEKIQSTLATLRFLNDKIQATEHVSATMKSLFADIITMLTTHFQQ